MAKSGGQLKMEQTEKERSEKNQKALLVENFLEKLDLNQITITEAVTDEKLEKSYKLIQQNPKITKKEFLKQMQIEEWTY